jgi:Na+-driven multidrug efflux pump
VARSQTPWRLPPARSPLDREIARLAIPAFGALIAEPLYILTDTAIVGHLGTPQLAGLAVASSVLLTLYAVFIFLA